MDTKRNLGDLQRILEIEFDDSALLKEAMTHSSFVNENAVESPVSNERLEFLGDAVLGVAIAEHLFSEFPDADEGFLTSMRASLIRRDVLAKIGRSIALGDYLLVGKGEESGGGRDKPANLAGALEAVLGAIFLDKGIEQTKMVVLKLFSDDLSKLSKKEEKDYKSRLQEMAQSLWQKTPVYEVVKTAGPDHARMFTVEVKIGDNIMGKGMGKSKKAAETEAARSALDRLKGSFTEAE